jgi:uncharacterized protein
MPMKRIFLRVAALGLCTTLFAAPAAAEEITPSHLAAAHDAVIAAKADRDFTDLLFTLSQQVQTQLINLRPDLYAQVSDAVNAMALQLAGRRADLDNDIARIWANAFTEDELKAIATFYKSPAGAKFVDEGPKVFTDGIQAAKGWSDRVREELLEKSREELKRRNVDF